MPCREKPKSVRGARQWFGVRLGAVPADQLHGVGESAAVVDEEATGAGEFVRLLGKHADCEFFTGQVGAGQ